MSKFTPGPWFTHREGYSTVYVEARIGGGMIQEVAACGPTAAGPEQQEANALLIAAAPEMLDALRRAVLALAFAAETSAAMRDDYEAVSAAIAKATRGTR